MLRYSHIMALLAACICCMWTLVFVWQDDMNQTQCSSYMWAVCLPASFAIHLVNFKAYRLYTFLAAVTQSPGNKRRRKTIGQSAVILRSIGMTMITAVILAFATGFDPPQVQYIPSLILPLNTTYLHNHCFFNMFFHSLK